MSLIALVQRYLLVAAAVTVLFSLSLHAMPLSWSKTARHRRSTRSTDSETERTTLPSDAGTVSQSPVDGPKSHGGTGNQTHNCMQECYDYVPQKQLERLREKVAERPHPSFFISEMAEDYHRREYCRSISTGDANIICESQNPTLSEEVKNDTTQHFLNYLNKIINTTASCGPKYEIEYHSDHYPRYKIHVVCLGNDDIRIKVGYSSRMFYLNNSTGWDLNSYSEVLVGCQCALTSSC